VPTRSNQLVSLLPFASWEKHHAAADFRRRRRLWYSAVRTEIVRTHRQSDR